MKRFLERKSPF